MGTRQDILGTPNRSSLEGFSPDELAAALERWGRLDLDIFMRWSEAGDPRVSALELAYRTLQRAAERCYVISTGMPRPKKRLPEWFPLLARMGFSLTEAEAELVRSAGEDDICLSPSDMPVAVAVQGRCRDSLGSLLGSQPIPGVRPFCRVHRNRPIEPEVLGLATEALGWAMEEYPDLRSPVVFGSRARGEERPDSDIDVAAISDLTKKPTGHDLLSRGTVELHVFTPEAWVSSTQVAALGARTDGIPIEWEEAR